MVKYDPETKAYALGQDINEVQCHVLSRIADALETLASHSVPQMPQFIRVETYSPVVSTECHEAPEDLTATETEVFRPKGLPMPQLPQTFFTEPYESPLSKLEANAKSEKKPKPRKSKFATRRTKDMNGRGKISSPA